MKINKTTGFTIVELLIVIVVIAILAAITIVAFNGVQARANNSAAQATVSQLYKKFVAAETAEEFGPSELLAGSKFNESEVFLRFVEGASLDSFDPNQEYSVVVGRSPNNGSFSVIGIGKSGDIFYIDNNNASVKAKPDWSDVLANQNKYLNNLQKSLDDPAVQGDARDALIANIAQTESGIASTEDLIASSAPFTWENRLSLMNKVYFFSYSPSNNTWDYNYNYYGE